MPRDLSSGMQAAVVTNRISLAILAILTFKSKTEYVWSGVGNLVYAGNTYLGVGSLGSVGAITESTDVHAYGTTVALSGIDPTLLGECLTDIKLGAPAVLLLALLDSSGNILGTPQTIFSGQVDKPSIEPGVKEVAISLALESKLTNLSRASNRRYTSADQQLYYPGDGFFNWVEQLNDIALKWTP